MALYCFYFRTIHSVRGYLQASHLSIFNNNLMKATTSRERDKIV